MMASAFAGYKLLMAAYEEAIKEKYRFFAYGDAMLILLLNGPVAFVSSRAIFTASQRRPPRSHPTAMLPKLTIQQSTTSTSQPFTRYAIIVAGGSGQRMGADRPKQFLLLAGEPVLLHTLRRFAEP
nr:hypothetical protein [Tanacetum cinerariifolium]